VDTAYELSHLDVDSERLLMNSLPWICGYLDSAHELYHVMRCSVLQCVAVCCSVLQCMLWYVANFCSVLDLSLVFLVDATVNPIWNRDPIKRN